MWHSAHQGRNRENNRSGREQLVADEIREGINMVFREGVGLNLSMLMKKVGPTIADIFPVYASQLLYWY